MCAAAQLDGIRGPFASQPGHFAVQSGYDAGQPSHPQSTFDLKGASYPVRIGVQRAAQPGSGSSASRRLGPGGCQPDRAEPEQSALPAHELTAGINLEKLRPLQWPPSVDPRQSIGNLCCGLASQRLSLFVA